MLENTEIKRVNPERADQKIDGQINNINYDESMRSPNAPNLKNRSGFRSPLRSNNIGVDLSNLAHSLAKKDVKKLNFADILDDVTYLPDPNQQNIAN